MGKASPYGAPVITFKVSGLAALAEALDELPKRLAQNVLRGAAAAGNAVILREARRLAPRDTRPSTKNYPRGGLYARALRAKRGVISRKTGEVSSGVSVNNKLLFKTTKGKRPTNLYHLLEYGHRIVVRRRIKGRIGKGKGAYQLFITGGRTKTYPHMAPALRSQSSAAIDAFAAYVRRRLDFEAKKAAQAAKGNPDA